MKITFSKYDLAGQLLDCVIVNDLDVYVLGFWDGEEWHRCFQVDTRTSQLKRLVDITPLYTIHTSGVRTVEYLEIKGVA